MRLSRRARLTRLWLRAHNRGDLRRADHFSRAIAGVAIYGV